MKLFLDTNVILDSVLKREGFLPASILLSLCDSKKVEGCVSILSMANIAYVTRKGRTREGVKSILEELSAMLVVLSMDNEQLQDSLAVDAPDIEDVLQYECAKAHGCDIIVTNNMKHFRFSDINVINTQEALAMLGIGSISDRQ